ncbi:hypothetical protein CTI12_AA088190 [Artemisia annua]|uniref:Uncharacterized protein n=1 Tax=Artemisia annua TaxID=35608 RepID=A0A2U1Q120_ARTAN|nr:hypothetical protein CTI12_AA088190 [Artemisia annua]
MLLLLRYTSSVGTISQAGRRARVRYLLGALLGISMFVNQYAKEESKPDPNKPAIAAANDRKKATTSSKQNS